MTLRIMAGLLFAGMIFNLLVRPVPSQFFMSEDELARERGHTLKSRDELVHKSVSRVDSWVLVLGFWGLVCLPLGWGIWRTLAQASALWGW